MFNASHFPPRQHLISLLVLWGALGSIGFAETYRVDGRNGNDENDGVSKPFKTLSRALRSLKTSDTLIIRKMDEPYREALRLRVGGTPERPLVIEGNGATVSGADPAPKTGWVGNGDIYVLAQPKEVKFLFGPETRYERAKSLAKLGEEQWTWADGKLYFRPTHSKTPADYDLEMSVRISGVATVGAGEIVVRDLICKHFWNDGFNIHGGSAPLWFENITGVWNGDEGFSAHENAECYVRGGYFAHNYWHGIADITFSRTHYANIVVRDNRMKGIYFTGGMHSVTDSEVSGSPINIALTDTAIKDWPHLDQHPLATSFANFRNVIVQSAGDEIGVFIDKHSEAVFEHCLIKGGRRCIRVHPNAKAYVVNSIIFAAKEAEVYSDGAYVADHNMYHPARFVIGGKAYGPKDFEAYCAATDNDAHSYVEEPKFIGNTLWLSRASRGKGKAAGGRRFGGFDIGLGLHGLAPFEPTSVVPPKAVRTDEGRIRFTYDFERDNPWSRVYPVPVSNKAGQKVVGASVLSTEQAHSGKHSAKLTVNLPPAPPQRYLIKLFSMRELSWVWEA